jgi:hypothetical protein
MSETSSEGQMSNGAFRSTPAISPEKRTNIERADLAPRQILPGESEIIFQRHGAYVRSTEDDTQTGRLTEAARADESRAAEDFIRLQLEAIPADERKDIKFLFIGSDTKYEGKGQRSMETASIASEAAKRILQEYSLDEEQVLNLSKNIRGDENVRPTSILREPNMTIDHREFFDYLKEKYGVDENGQLTLDGWIAFEEDTEKEVREQMETEGPDELADRIKKSLAILTRFASIFHYRNPEQRLVIWATTHYDTISPFVKRDLLGASKEVPVGVKYGAGIVFKVDKDGNEDTIIGDATYSVLN